VLAIRPTFLGFYYNATFLPDFFLKQDWFEPLCFEKLAFSRFNNKTIRPTRDRLDHFHIIAGFSCTTTKSELLAKYALIKTCSDKRKLCSGK
jgi:hypothetical protein